MYPILRQGKKVGTLSAQKNGLYWDILAECEEHGQPLRLYARNGQNAAFRLGIPIPYEGRLRLQSSVPQTSFCFCGDTEIFLGPPPLLICGAELPDAELGTDEKGRFLLVPYEPSEPFRLMERVCFFTILQKDGKRYWFCRLDEKNTPIFG